MHRRTVIGGVASLAALGGCLGRVEDEPGAETVARLAENERAIDGVSGRVRLERSVDGETTERRVTDVWGEPDGPVRQEVRGEDDGQEMTLVADDDETWVYFPEAGGAANLEFRLEYAGAYPFEYETVLDHLDAYDVEHRGREEVAGRTADRLVCRATDLGDVPEIEYYTFRIGSEDLAGYAPERVEFWIDEEYEVPLGRSIRTGNSESTVRFEEVTLDRPIPDDRFAFEPPPDVEVLDWAEGFVEFHETVEQAETRVGFEFDLPARVDGYERDSISAVYTERGTRLQGYYFPEESADEYERGDEEYADSAIDARTWRSTVDPDLDGEATTVGGREAVVERDGQVRLAFDCDGRTREFVGPDEEGVRAVAEAVDCGG